MYEIKTSKSIVQGKKTKTLIKSLSSFVVYKMQLSLEGFNIKVYVLTILILDGLKTD